MRTLYFDCFAGASGDMILGALVACGADERLLVEQLRGLDVAEFELDFERVERAGIAATKAHVRVPQEHAHRNLNDVVKIIDEANLDAKVKRRAIEIFTRLAAAEASVHNESINQVHFHEVGAMDAIIDIVGACIGFELLQIEKFAASELHVGSGMVEMAHGRFPVPPPAVIELLKDAPIYSTDIKGELLTPTGAAIISTLCEAYGTLPAMRVQASGYGAGGREYKNFPNALRVLIGETNEAEQNAANDFRASNDNRETLMMIETNVDDASPQLIGFVMDEAFRRGALDCFFTAIQMKKNRPAVLISILCTHDKTAAMRALLFTETTTIGIRETQVTRYALARRIVKVETEFGAIDVKVSSNFAGDESNVTALTVTPEFEQLRAAASNAKVAVRQVEVAARIAFEKQRGADEK